MARKARPNKDELIELRWHNIALQGPRSELEKILRGEPAELPKEPDNSEQLSEEEWRERFGLPKDYLAPPPSFYDLALKALGLECLPHPRAIGADFEDCPYFCKADYTELGCFVLQRVPGVTMDNWWKADRDQRREYLHAALNKEMPTADDFVPISKVYQEHFDSLTKAKRFLEAHPEVRSRKPSRQRLEVHAGDWTKYWARQSPPSDADVARFLDGIEQAKAKERRK